MLGTPIPAPSSDRTCRRGVVDRLLDRGFASIPMSGDRAPRWATSFRQRPGAGTVALFGCPAALFCRARSKLVEWDRRDGQAGATTRRLGLRPDCMFIDI